jgi:hypothetical protein
MRKVIALIVACGSFAAIAAPGALANNPHPEGATGKPEFSCQEINKANGTGGEPNPFAPGKAQFSPGSPFNEGEGTGGPGNGGAHYSENARYDVACYQHQQHAEAGH